jgi:hypothetical protein
MIEFMIESQTIMDRQTINEKYCDAVVGLASETGWSIDYIMELPPWTFNQINDSRKRIYDQAYNNNKGEILNNKDKLLG